jgi:hypothetical protein
MPRRKSKYGIEEPNLISLIETNFLNYAMNPSGAKYVSGFAEFVSNPKRVEKYKRRTARYFSALQQLLMEDPTIFKRALAPVYEKVFEREARVAVRLPTLRPVEVMIPPPPV